MKDTKKTFDKTEDDLKALQSMGQIIGEVLRQLDDEKCASSPEIQAPPAPFKREPDSLRNSAPPSLFSPTLADLSLPAPSPVIVKASSGPRYVVGVRTKLDKEKLVNGTRVALDMTTLTIIARCPARWTPSCTTCSTRPPVTWTTAPSAASASRSAS